MASEKILDLERQTLATEREALKLRRIALQEEFDALNEGKEAEWTERYDELQRKNKEIDDKIKGWQQQVARTKQFDKKRIRLNVGGTIFETTHATLMAKHEPNFLAALASQHWAEAKQDELFIDRDPTFFGHILNYLRGVPLPVSNGNVKAELDFYGLNAVFAKKNKATTAAKPETRKIVNIFKELAGHLPSTESRTELHPGIICLSVSHTPLYRNINIASILNATSDETYSGNADIVGAQWVAFEFKTVEICPVHYNFQCGARAGPDHLMRNWVFEGSNNATDWTVLLGHVNDQQNRSSNVAHEGWVVSTPLGTFYRHLRIRTTGETDNRSNQWPFNVFRLHIHGEMRPLQQSRKRARSDDEDESDEEEVVEEE